jgi:hypothetical protein
LFKTPGIGLFKILLTLTGSSSRGDLQLITVGEPHWKRVLRREIVVQHCGDVSRKGVGDAVADGVGYVVVHGCVVDERGGIVVAVEYAGKGSSCREAVVAVGCVFRDGGCW